MKNLWVLGGDGFCGWPTSLYFSERGMKVTILDNFSRRKIDDQLGVASLTPIRDLETRIKTWEALSGNKIRAKTIDLSLDFEQLLELLVSDRPDAIIHFAEQRSAPFSMRSPNDKRYTVSNNLGATHNILLAIATAKLDTHLIHLGTMGVYGYDDNGYDLPEGYIDVEFQGRDGTKAKVNILHPSYPGSIYHMTKAQDQLMFQFYAKNNGVRITDLHQGIVWGTQTPETSVHLDLINRFDYDGEYGTVLNRFIVQAAKGCPLTVYGTGGQKRAFININDMLRCIELAIISPPKSGERPKIYNQMTETYTVLQVAKLVSELFSTDIQYVDNPRKELVANELFVSNTKFLDHGLTPTLLEHELVIEALQIVKSYLDRVDTTKFMPQSRW